MSSKKIVVLNGHPGDKSLSKSLSVAYGEAAEAQGHVVRWHDLSQMSFDMDHGDGGYKVSKPLEAPLAQFLEDLEWAEHVVMATPMWWGMVPAKLKGLFDRVLLPGRAFDTRTKQVSGLPTPLMTGKTARVFLTSDTPSVFLRLMYGNAIKKIISRQLFGFIGVKPTRFTAFAAATAAKDAKVDSWLKKAAALGAQAV